MRIVGIMPAYGRPGITRETLRLLKERQGYPFHQIIVMGSGPLEEAPAREAGCDFLKVPNEPLGRKYQCGLAWSMVYEPDAVCVLGSDTWLSEHWLAVAAQEIFTGADIVGRIDFYSLHAVKGQGVQEILHRRYPEGGFSAQTPVGGGRVISRSLLDRMGWDVFPISQSNAIDTGSYLRMAEHAARVCIVDGEGTAVMGIKGPWETLNRFANLKKSSRLENLGNVPLDAVAPWMARMFPGGLEALERVLENS